MRRLIALAILGGCGGGGGEPRPAGEIVLELATEPGLSGLSLAPDGALWTVAERSRTAYRIVLDGDRIGTLETIAIEGLPEDLDIEAIEAGDFGPFWLGTEGNGTASAQVWIADLAGGVMTVRPEPDALVPDRRVVEPNHGVEGLCFDGGAGAVALETAIDEGGRRLGQLGLVRGAGPGEPRHVILTSKTGKISGIDCTRFEDGVEILAIERHFEVTRIIRFRLSSLTAPAKPEVVYDLARMAKGRNFEGLARLPDGRIALVTDNQWKTIDGPSQLVLLPPP